MIDLFNFNKYSINNAWQMHLLNPSILDGIKMNQVTVGVMERAGSGLRLLAQNRPPSSKRKGQEKHQGHLMVDPHKRTGRPISGILKQLLKRLVQM